MKEFDDFQSKFRVNELLVHKSQHWSWSVRPAQPTLGCGVLSLNRYAAQFSEVSAEENADLQTIVQCIEHSLQKTFRFDKINYLMLMMVDPHVHFHIIPRYADTRIFAEQSFHDAGWPAVPSLKAETSPDDLLHALCDTLRKA